MKNSTTINRRSDPGDNGPSQETPHPLGQIIVLITIKELSKSITFISKRRNDRFLVKVEGDYRWLIHPARIPDKSDICQGFTNFSLKFVIFSVDMIKTHFLLENL